MADFRIDHHALVLVGDGEKALFFRNKGDRELVNLIVEDVFEQDNPATREQGTDRPGRMHDASNPHRSAVEPTDWHRIAEERFAAEVAEALYKGAHQGRYDKLVIVAPPRVLGELRRALHKEVQARLVAEVNKTLTSHPIDQIEKLLTA